MGFTRFLQSIASDGVAFIMRKNPRDVLLGSDLPGIVILTCALDQLFCLRHAVSPVLLLR